MRFRQIHFIINPASTKEEPVLSLIYKAFKGTGTKWAVSVTQPTEDAGMIAARLAGKTDLVAVYGGDGCVTTVAAALHGTKTPMAILPAGTANVMAKELAIPMDTADALAVLQKGKHKVKAVDMGLVNNEPFLLRVNLGIMADMVLEAPRGLKNKIGQLAYGVSTLKTVAQATSSDYHLNIDGIKKEASGVSLTVTNSGHMGVADMELQPGISISDGLLNVILMKDNDLLSVLKVAGSTLLGQPSETLEHWTAKKIVITLPRQQVFICDDAPRKAKKLTIAVSPGSVQILVPC